MRFSAKAPQVNNANKGAKQGAHNRAQSSSDCLLSKRRLWGCADHETKEGSDESESEPPVDYDTFCGLLIGDD
jgi:hypothetical protein